MHCAVGEVDAIPGVLPALADKPVRIEALVLDKPVTVFVAVMLDPVQRLSIDLP